MIEIAALGKKNIRLSAVLLCLSLSVFIYGDIADRWPELFGALFTYLIGFILWLVLDLPSRMDVIKAATTDKAKGNVMWLNFLGPFLDPWLSSY